MSNQVVRVKKGLIAACMTCPLCHNLVRDATTISLCLHTFCRKCIHKKLSDEEVKCCPICEIDLGVVPLKKLRPDHNLQDVRLMVFPFKRRKTDAPEAAPSLASPARRKERSLSSLVVDTSRVSPQMTGRRSRVTARETSCGSSVSNEKQMKKGEDSESSTSSEILTKFTQHIKQNSATGEPSSHPVPDKHIKDPENEINTREGKGKVDLWKPMNCVVEAANRSKSSKFTLPGSALRTEPTSASPKTEGHSRTTKWISKVHDGKDSTDIDPPESMSTKKTQRMLQKKNTFTVGKSVDQMPEPGEISAGGDWESHVEAKGSSIPKDDPLKDLVDLDFDIDIGGRGQSEPVVDVVDANDDDEVNDDEDDEMKGPSRKSQSVIETSDRPSKRTFLSKNTSLRVGEQCQEALQTLMKRRKNGFYELEQELDRNVKRKIGLRPPAFQRERLQSISVLREMARRAVENSEKTKGLSFNTIQFHRKSQSAIETSDRPSKRTFLSKNPSLRVEQCQKVLQTFMQRRKNALHEVMQEFDRNLKRVRQRKNTFEVGKSFEVGILSETKRRAAENSEKAKGLFNSIQSHLERAKKVREDLVAERSRNVTRISELSTELSKLKEKEVSIESTLKEKDREIQQLKDALSAVPKEENIIAKFNGYCEYELARTSTSSG